MVKMKGEQSIYLPGLNGLRAIAAIAVILSHINVALPLFGLTKQGSILLAEFSVTIFFVISGFLITYLLLHEKDKQAIKIGNFYIRRMLRIWPLYYLFIFLCLLLVNKPEMYSTTMLYYLFFAANIPFIIDTAIGLFVHLWSIGVEEQFYLLWPWLMKFSTKALIPITFLIIAVLIGLKVYARFGLSGGSESLLYRIIHITRFQCLLIGAAGAVFYKSRNRIFLKWFGNKVVQIISWLLLALVVINHFHVLRAIDQEIIALVALALIIGQIHPQKKLINLENPVLDYLGKISYGIYIYHPLVIILWIFVLNQMNMNDTLKYILIYTGIIGITILTAHLSFHYYEKPFLKLKKRFTTIRSANSMLVKNY